MCLQFKLSGAIFNSSSVNLVFLFRSLKLEEASKLCETKRAGEEAGVSVRGCVPPGTFVPLTTIVGRVAKMSVDHSP